MRFLALIIAVLATLALVACGGGEEKPLVRMSPAEIAKLPPIEIETRTGAPPHKLVIHDLRIGTGAVMKSGDSTHINWAEAPYGEAFHTSPSSPFKRGEFAFGAYVKGWEKGIPGMRVGGRRELIVPARLVHGTGAMIYVLDLLSIYRG